MPANGPDEWRARIGHWENRKLRWYKAHCGSRPRVPLYLRLEGVILEAPQLCILLLVMASTYVYEGGNGALSILSKLGRSKCCACYQHVRVNPLTIFLCLALSLLLIRAGDVETNPGPISGEETLLN